MKIKVRNISDKTQSLKARVLRNGGLVETEFQILPKATSTLVAEKIFEIDNPVVMAAKSLVLLSVEQDAAPAAQSQEKPQASFDSKQKTRTTAPAADGSN